MLFIDTNAFYYASGVSTNFTYDIQKLMDAIKGKDVCISTTSLFEFIVKNANDRQALALGESFIKGNGIRIVGNRLNPIPENFIMNISDSSSASFKRMYAEIIENKIDVESRYTTMLFDMCLFSGLYFAAMSDGKEPSDYCYAVVETAFKMFSKDMLSVFKRVYEDGYKTDDCENYVRNAFNNLLGFTLEKSIPFVEKSKIIVSEEEFINVDAWIDENDYKQRTSVIASKIATERSAAFLQRLAIKYWKSNDDDHLEKHIVKLTEPFNKRISWIALQDYYHDTLSSIMTNKAAFWKNSLLDAIILCNLENDHTIITYDGGMIARMERRKDVYHKYKESLDLIYQLKE